MEASRLFGWNSSREISRARNVHIHDFNSGKTDFRFLAKDGAIT